MGGLSVEYRLNTRARRPEFRASASEWPPLSEYGETRLRVSAVTAMTDSPATPEGRLVRRAPGQLRPHPVYPDVRAPAATVKTPHGPAGPPVIAPLLTTRDGLILDGHERWQLAVGHGRESVEHDTRAVIQPNGANDNSNAIISHAEQPQTEGDCET